MTSQAQIEIAKKIKRLPLWSRLMIGAVSLGIVLSFALVLVTSITLKNAFEHCQEPDSIREVAGNITQFPDPLPEGFRYHFGLDLKLFRIVSLDYSKGKQQIVFMGYETGSKGKPPDAPEQFTSDSLLRRAHELGVNTISVQSRFGRTLQEGSWTIHKQRIPYIVSELADAKGTGLVASMVDSERGKAFILYVSQTGSGDFEMKGLIELIQQISGF